MFKVGDKVKIISKDVVGEIKEVLPVKLAKDIMGLFKFIYGVRVGNCIYHIREEELKQWLEENENGSISKL